MTKCYSVPSRSANSSNNNGLIIFDLAQGVRKDIGDNISIHNAHKLNGLWIHNGSQVLFAVSK